MSQESRRLECKLPNRVLLFDGSIKLLKDVNVGDLLVSPDGRPLNVTNVLFIYDDLLKIVQKYGDNFVLPINNKLPIKYTNTYAMRHKTELCEFTLRWHNSDRIPEITHFRYKSAQLDRRYDYDTSSAAKLALDAYMNDNPIQNIYTTPTIWEYMTGAYTFDDRNHTYKHPGLEFPEQILPIDPYLLGLWLGDGSSRETVITNIDPEVIAYLYESAGRMGIRVNRWINPDGTPGVNYSFTSDTKNEDANPFRSGLKNLGLLNNKHIPLIYQQNSREHRLLILAGLLDTDGRYDQYGYEISQKKEIIADGITYIARSLGFYVRKSKVTKVCTNAKDGPKAGIYYEVAISGSGLEHIPTRIPRKKASVRRSNRDPLTSGFYIEKWGRDICVKLTLDGGKQYLAGDFTVMHV